MFVFAYQIFFRYLQGNLHTKFALKTKTLVLSSLELATNTKTTFNCNIFLCRISWRKVELHFRVIWDNCFYNCDWLWIVNPVLLLVLSKSNLPLLFTKTNRKLEKRQFGRYFRFRDAVNKKKQDISWHCANFIWYLPTLPNYDIIYLWHCSNFLSPTYLHVIVTNDKLK